MTAVPPSARTLSKSDFMLARSCDAKLYFRKNGFADGRSRDPYAQMLAEGGFMVEALACALHPDGIMVVAGSLEDEIALTRELLERETVTLFQGTIAHGRCISRVDILQKRGRTIRLLEVKAKSFDGAAHAEQLAAGKPGVFRNARKPFDVKADWRMKFEDVAYQTILLERMLPSVTVQPHLVLVDKCKRSTVDDLPALFELTRHDGPGGRRKTHAARFVGNADQLAQLDLLTEVDCSGEVASIRDGVDKERARFEGLLDAGFDHVRLNAPLGHKCNECEFVVSIDGAPSGFEQCWGAMANVAPHALELFGIGTVKDDDGTPIMESLASRGRVSLFDIPLERLAKKDGSVGPQAERQRRQVEYTRRGATWVAPTLGPSLATLRYPLHFIDFECSRLALPYHAKMRPYGQTAFQWSCHTVDAPGAQPRHAEWLNDARTWPNLDFVRSLRDVIGDSDTVLTWSAFERSQLNEIAYEHPIFSGRDEELIAWVRAFDGRSVDLHDCAKNEYYHPGMRGRTSIKVVLDALWKSDPAMRDQFVAWTGMSVSAEQDPYHALPALMINGVAQDVREGTGAMRAYEAMMYGVEKDDAVARQQWRDLLLQYCRLDTLSMVLVFEHWRRVTLS